MSDYDDTGVEPTEDSSSSDSMPETLESGDIDYSGGEAAEPGPVPYERFKEVNDTLSGLRDSQNEYEGRIQGLQSRLDESAQWSQWAWGELQKNQRTEAPTELQSDDDYYDSTSKELNQLKSEFTEYKQNQARRHQQMQVDAAEKELVAEINQAKSQHPEMSELEVINALTQNPNASVAALAKRSHERNQSKMEDYARRRGFRPPPKALQRPTGNPPKAQDFGDDLDAAERAAMADFGVGDF